MYRALFTLVLVLSVATASLAAATSAASQPAAEGWARLGPQGPGSITAIAIAPGWPTDRLILAIREEALVRSRDGGASWERLIAPATVREEYVRFFGLLPSAQAQSTAFLLIQDPSPQATTPWRLLRSTDAGTSWSIVQTGPPVTPAPRIVFSPDFQRDGSAFLIVGGELWRTRTAGVSWDTQLAVAGQRVQQVALSPNFAADRTVFVAVALHDRPTASSAAEPRATDHEESIGILVSRDGGDTWDASSTGLRVDETPYRNVYDLAVSPTYRQDGTVFAFAAGPVAPTEPRVALLRSSWSGRLFRSTDRGETWQAVAALAPQENQGEVTLALSPTFAGDGRAFAAVEFMGPTPASAGCTVLSSENAGRDWSVAVPPVPYSGCERVQTVGGGVDFSMLVRRGGQWSATPGGLGERLLQRASEGPALAAPVPYAISSIVPAADALRDSSVFVGAWGGGIWAYGTDVRRTDGRLMCLTEVGPTFRQLYESEGWVHGWLGCATGAERRVTVRELEYQPRQLPNLTAASDGESEDLVTWDLRGYWTEDDDPIWFRLSEHSWSGLRKGDVPWPNGLFDVLDATLQRFDGGLLIRLNRGSQPGSTLVLIGRGDSGSWRELPDGPAAIATATPPATSLSP